MSLFGHHTHGFFEMEIMGKPFPDGPTERVIAFTVAAVAVVFMLYGGYAMVRDLLRHRARQRAEVRR